jgi:hypothetical protein
MRRVAADADLKVPRQMINATTHAAATKSRFRVRERRSACAPSTGPMVIALPPRSATFRSCALPATWKGARNDHHFPACAKSQTESQSLTTCCSEGDKRRNSLKVLCPERRAFCNGNARSNPSTSPMERRTGITSPLLLHVDASRIHQLEGGSSARIGASVPVLRQPPSGGPAHLLRHAHARCPRWCTGRSRLPATRLPRRR